MSEYSYNAENEEEKIDLTGFVYDFLSALKRTWWIVLLLAAVCGGLMYLKEKVSYTPMYKAEATVSVTTDGGYQGNDSSSANMIAKVFPYMMSSGMLAEKIEADLGTSYVPATVTVSNIQGTNLLTITSVSSNPTNAYSVLQSVIENYDSVTKYVVGNTSVEVYSDTGMPESPMGAAALRTAAAMGAGIGALIGALVTAFYMFMYRTVEDSEALSKLVNLRYLGTLPFYRKKKRSKGTTSINILDKKVQQDYLEAMRLIRTRVVGQMKKHNAKVLMVTSSIPGEGKSTVSCNLAVSLAREGSSVVLVDCDLRNPSVQEVLRIEGNYPGIEAMLNGTASYADVTCSYANVGLELRVIPGSKELSDNAELFASDKMSAVLEQLKEKADYIILDTPPAGLLVDSMFAVKKVDAVLYVIMCDYTRRHIIQRSVSELADTGVPMIGAILNGGKKPSKSHGYGYGYKKYGNYGETGRYTSNHQEEEDE